MKIQRLHIYGFGRHSNVTIDLGDRITVFYGENEAGKTTIYQFMLQVLFGFPQKNSSLMRYEPKNGSAYGGKIILTDPQYGVVEVERVRGKSAGDVTVRFDDGRVGGQLELNDILRQYDRTAFESIFSFSLFQLQGLENMDSEQLSRTLLSSGTTGIDLLMQLEKKLEKEKAELFKKSGKNPRMNVLLKELHELEESLQKQMARVDEYEPALQRLGEVEQQLSALRHEVTECQNDSKQMQNALLRIPIIEKKQMLVFQIDALQTTMFPPNGIREQEMLESKKREAEAIIARSTFQLQQMTDELDEKVQKDREVAVEDLLAKESDWQALHQEVMSIKSEITRLIEDRQRLLGRLGALEPNSKETVLQVDSSLINEQRIHELAEHVQQVDRGKQSTQLEFQRIQELERRSTQHLNQLNAEAPTQEEQAQAATWPTVRGRLSEAKAYMSFAKSEQQSSSNSIVWILLVVALGVVGFGLLQQQWGIVALGVILSLLSGYVMMQKKQAPTSSDDRTKEMNALLNAYEGKEEFYEALCRRIDDFTRKKEHLTTISEGHSMDVEALKNDLLRAEQAGTKARKLLQEELQSCGLTPGAGMEVIPELFRMIRDVQRTEQHVLDRQEELQSILEKIEKHKETARTVLEREVPEADLYTLVRQEARQLRDAVLMVDSVHLQVKQLSRTVEEKSVELETYSHQEQQLFKQARAHDKQSFYDAYDRWQRKQTAQLSIDSLTEQLNTLADVEEFGEDEQHIQDQLREVEERRAVAENEISERTDERAALLHKTEALLTDDAHLLTQQLYENKKSEFNARAFEWSSRQVAAEAIRQTMADLKDKKLPAVLSSANHIFNQLTNGRYSELSIHSDGQFQAVREDGTVFAIAELSQATKEQAYVSLRLSLAGELTEQAPFPLIMDDPFVHFDAKRLKLTTELLSELSSRHQFIVFTCHETLAPHWRDAKLIHVNEIGNTSGGVEL